MRESSPATNRTIFYARLRSPPNLYSRQRRSKPADREKDGEVLKEDHLLPASCPLLDVTPSATELGKARTGSLPLGHISRYPFQHAVAEQRVEVEVAHVHIADMAAADIAAARARA